MKLLKKIKNMVIKYFYDLFHFGIKVAHYNFFGELVDFNVIKGNKANKIVTNRDKYINKFLMKKYSSLINEYKDKKIDNKQIKKNIWCLWWQGLDSAPELVKKCVESIDKYKGDYNLVIITKDNYQEYANIPSIIIDKLNKKIITITHFSDILRANLLSNYGGIWVDATMYFTNNIFNNFDNVVFNSNRKDNIGDYCGYFMGGKPNKLFFFLYDFLIEYNSHYNKLINYFLIDYVIKIAYHNFSECKSYIDNITLNNPNIYELVKQFNNRYEKKDYNELMKNNYFKLTYKKNFKEYDKDNQLTNYGYFMKKD